MTRWKKDETEFNVRLTEDGRNSVVCRVPKPIRDFLNNPTSITFLIVGNEIKLREKNKHR